MEEMIYLTKAQADKVRGRHGRYSALVPLLADDGKYVLPKDVLNDSEHLEVFDDLVEARKVNIEPEEVIIDKDISALILKVKNISQSTIAESVPAGWKILKGYKIPIPPKAGDLFTKGLGLFNYSKPVTNFRGQKVSRWSLIKDLLKEIWRRIKKLFRCSTK